MGNCYILVAVEEGTYVSFNPYCKENEILLNKYQLQLAVGFLRQYDMGYGGGAGVFAFIGDQWTPYTVFDDGKLLTFEYVIENYEDVTDEVIEDLIESGILKEGDAKDAIDE